METHSGGDIMKTLAIILIFMSIGSLAFAEPLKVHVTLTAYSARKCETDSTPTITASGKKVRPGIVALSRDLEALFGFKFGDKIILEGHKELVFEDRMHKRKKLQLDIFMTKTKDALKFGVKKGILILEAKKEKLCLIINGG
jgi:3D (Asp-Asp-Asp) domain-containing protein